MAQRVAIISGGRTPFVKARKAFEPLSPLALAKQTVQRLIAESGINAKLVEALALGAVVPEPGKPNLAREIVLETDLPDTIEAQTISSYCISGLRSATTIADAIASGRASVGIAAGVEWLSGADISTFKEPTTGLLMGQHQELTTKKWKVARERQDQVVLASHKNAVAAREKLAQEIFPLAGVDQDTGPRDDTSIEALAALKPAFGEDGSLTAGNSSPVTDGAAAVLLASEQRAKQEGWQPKAFIRAMQYGAISIDDGLLMAPARVVPALLKRTGVSLSSIDLIEIHEAFAAQVLCNVAAWETGWQGAATGPVDWDRVNVNGGSIALGHPWAATGGRIINSLANEMERQDASLGLISICAAGAMAGAFLLERA